MCMKIINLAEDKRKEKNTCIFDLLNKEIFSATNNIDLAQFFFHFQFFIYSISIDKKTKVTKRDSLSSIGEVKAHNSVVGIQERGEGLKVGGATWVGLDVHPPLVGVQAEGLQGPGLTQALHFVNKHIPSIVPGIGFMMWSKLI